MNSNPSEANNYASPDKWKECEAEVIALLRNRADPKEPGKEELLRLSNLLLQSESGDRLRTSTLMAIAKYLESIGQENEARVLLRKLIPSLIELQASCQPATASSMAVGEVSYTETRIAPEYFGGSLEKMLSLIDLKSGQDWLAKSILNIFGRFSCLPINEICTNLMTSGTKKLDIDDSALHQPEIASQEAENAAEKLNLHHLSHFSTFWLDAVRKQTISLITDNPSGTYKAMPNGSFLINEKCGSIIGFPFIISGTIFVPLYTGWVSHIEGFVVANADLSAIAIILNSSALLSSHFDEAKEAILYFLKHELSKWEDTPIDDNPYILIGQRINYGHTIINDSCVLALLKCMADRSIKFNLALGEWDYFSTVSIMEEVGCNIIEESCQWITIDEFQTKAHGLYSFPSKLIFPVPSMRPPSESLNLIKQIKEPVTNPQRIENKTFLLQLDSRGGSRKCINQYALIDKVMSIAKACNHLQLVIDGFTSIPCYRKISGELATSIVKTKLPTEIRDYISRQAEEFGLHIIWIDGLLLHQKLKELRGSSIIKSLAPYGSGAMTPIYLINSTTGLYGHETYSNVRDAWKWHVTKYCHSQREQIEIYIDSIDHGNSGYNVDLSAVASFLTIYDDKKC